MTGFEPSKPSPAFPEPDGVFGGINLLTASLSDLDDRGLVLALAAFAEETLGTLLEAFMRPNKAARRLLEGFNAPLGTLSSRIAASYAFGLITMEQFEDLEHLRKIRNAYSHTWRQISFDDDRISGHIRAIHFSSIDDEFPESNRDKLRTALSSVLIELQVAANQIRKQGTRTPEIGRRLVSGLAGDAKQQIDTARTRIAGMEEEFRTAAGEKRAFLLVLRERWMNRLPYIEAAASADFRAEIAGVCKELRQRLASLTD